MAEARVVNRLPKFARSSTRENAGSGLTLEPPGPISPSPAFAPGYSDAARDNPPAVRDHIHLVAARTREIGSSATQGPFCIGQSKAAIGSANGKSETRTALLDFSSERHGFASKMKVGCLQTS